MNFSPVRLPEDVAKTKIFTVMDTTEQSVFLHIQKHGPAEPMGNIYISDYSGRYYSDSLNRIAKLGDYVDFEKVNSLEGVYLANQVIIR